MKKGAQIYTQGLESFPLSRVIFSNVLMLIWIGLGTVACWFAFPVVAWLYLAAAIIMIFVVLRKLVCTNCYYYGKQCALGWGKISALFFSPGSIDQFSTCAGIKAAPITYGLLTLIPLVLCIVALVQEVTALKVAVLVLLLAVAVYSGAISRKVACTNCKMRLICPGSAAR
ncbi:MAG TPA: hypothetical protein ENN35_08795 [Deltaproteobacteria bacterium]|nr:hypothetical protein [Deltaproteobacteria bacterium]